MEHSLENQLQLPVTVNGTDFPRLEMADLIKWTAEEKNNARTAAERRYAKNGPGAQGLSPFECQQMIQGVIDKGYPMGRLLEDVREAPGVHKALILSLKKAGKSDGEAVAILKGIHFLDQYQLAQDVLSPPAPVEAPAAEPKGEDESPLPAGDAVTSPSSST